MLCRRRLGLVLDVAAVLQSFVSGSWREIAEALGSVRIDCLAKRGKCKDLSGYLESLGEPFLLKLSKEGSGSANSRLDGGVVATTGDCCSFSECNDCWCSDCSICACCSSCCWWWWWWSCCCEQSSFGVDVLGNVGAILCVCVWLNLGKREVVVINPHHDAHTFGFGSCPRQHRVRVRHIFLVTRLASFFTSFFCEQQIILCVTHCFFFTKTKMEEGAAGKAQAAAAADGIVADLNDDAVIQYLRARGIDTAKIDRLAEKLSTQPMDSSSSGSSRHGRRQQQREQQHPLAPQDSQELVSNSQSSARSNGSRETILSDAMIKHLTTTPSTTVVTARGQSSNDDDNDDDEMSYLKRHHLQTNAPERLHSSGTAAEGECLLSESMIMQLTSPSRASIRMESNTIDLSEQFGLSTNPQQQQQQQEVEEQQQQQQDPNEPPNPPTPTPHNESTLRVRNRSNNRLRHSGSRRSRNRGGTRRLTINRGIFHRDADSDGSTPRSSIASPRSSLAGGSSGFQMEGPSTDFSVLGGMAGENIAVAMAVEDINYDDSVLLGSVDSHTVAATTVAPPTIDASPFQESETIQRQKREIVRLKKRRRLTQVALIVLALVVIVVTTVSIVLLSRNDTEELVPSSSPSSSPTLSTLELEAQLGDVLSQITPRELLMRNGTAENTAFQWLVREDGYMVIPGEVPQEQIWQRYALALLYFGTGGNTTWLDRKGFLTPTQECGWTNGILECTPQGLVTVIDLSKNIHMCALLALIFLSCSKQI